MVQKSIQLKGINRAIPQSDAPDGACQEIINMRFRKGCWRPVPGKMNLGSAVFTYIPYVNGFETLVFDAIYLHDIEGGIIPGSPNWIGVKNNRLFLINPVTRYATLLDSNLDTSVTLKVAFLKRFLLLTTGKGIFMYLYSSTGYAKVETLPTPDVDLHKNNLSIVKYPQSGAARFENNNDDATGDKKTAMATLLSNYYEVLNNQSSTEGRLFGSVMYIAAYRLFDGSYIMPTVPKYFEISNAGVVTCDNGGGTGNYAIFIEMTLSGLKASINSTPLNSFANTKDLVESVCIFATRATPTRTIDETTAITSIFKIPADNGKHLEFLYSELFPLNPALAKLSESEGWHKIHEFRFDEVVATTGRLIQDVDTKGYYQDYATRETLTTDQFSHHKLAAKTLYAYNDRLHIASIKTIYGDGYVSWPKFFDGYDMGSGAATGKSVVWLKTALGEVSQVATINVPQYRKTTNVVENKATVELANARVAYLNASPPAGYVVGSAYVKKKFIPVNHPDNVDKAHAIFNFTVTANVVSFDVVYRTLTGDTTLYYVIPESIGYNDGRAYRMMITANISGVEKVLTDKALKKNVGMNFAYFVADNYLPKVPAPSDLTVTGTIPAAGTIAFDTNRVQVSEIQNPLVYPAANSYQVGTGDIIAIAAGSEPLSSGQFGQFPLQVFTTKGIHAMEIGLGDVLYTNILPVNGEVADNANNIIPVMGGVAYSTEKGLFVVSGRQVVQLSEIVEGLPETSMSTSKTEITTLLTNSRFTPGLAGSLSDMDFLEYLKTSSIGFDQLNKELIVTNSTKAYSYIYSFESKLWYKVSRSYNLLINAWPRLYGITNTDVFDLSQEETIGNVEVMIITSAQSFEMKDIPKKINRAILRSLMSVNSDTKAAGLYVFASDDAETYQIIIGRQNTGIGIKDLMIQNSPGSAKYFVIVVNGQLGIDSEIKELDIDFVAKWNRKLR